MIHPSAGRERKRTAKQRTRRSPPPREPALPLGLHSENSWPGEWREIPPDGTVPLLQPFNEEGGEHRKPPWKLANFLEWKPSREMISLATMGENKGETFDSQRRAGPLWFVHEPNAPDAATRLACQLNEITEWCRAHSTETLVVMSSAVSPRPPILPDTSSLARAGRSAD